MIISDKIYIDLNKEPEPVLAEMLDLLTYKNPDYYQKMNMGLSVWGVPKEVKTYSLKDRVITVLRGEYYKVRPYLKSPIVETQHAKHDYVDIEYVNNDFALDDYQEVAVKAIITHKQGVVHAVTSAGKSLIILKAICEQKLPALIVIHRKILMEQFLNDIEKYVRTKSGKKITPGIIGNGSYTFGPITIAIDKSLARHIDEVKQSFSVVFLDECHLAPAETMLDLINSINSEFRYGVSGTLRRKDQKEFLIFATFGRVIATITKEQLLALGRIVPVELKIVESETKFDLAEAIDSEVTVVKKNKDGTVTTKKRKLGLVGALQLLEKTLSLDPLRNKLILDLVAKLPGKTIVLSKLVKPCYSLSAALRDCYGIESGVITGKDSKEALASYEAMKFKDLRLIFATIGCVSTGVSISDLDNIVLISPLYTNELLIHQIRGRLMRVSEGKEKGTLYYIYDGYIYDQRKLKKFINIMDS